MKNDNLIKSAVAANPGCDFGVLFAWVWERTVNKANGETGGRLRVYEWVVDLVRRGELKEVKTDVKRYWPSDE